MSPIIAKRPDANFSPAPEGLHPAVCVDVIDQGLQPNPWSPDAPVHRIQIRWQTEEIDPENSRPYLLIGTYRNSLHEKAKLRHHLEAWRGKKLTDQELGGFDLDKLVGACGQLQVVHNRTAEGIVYANVQAIVPLAKGMTKPRANGYVRVKDRQPAPPATVETEAATDDDLPF